MLVGGGARNPKPGDFHDRNMVGIGSADFLCQPSCHGVLRLTGARPGTTSLTQLESQSRLLVKQDHAIESNTGAATETSCVEKPKA